MSAAPIGDIMVTYKITKLKIHVAILFCEHKLPTQNDEGKVRFDVRDLILFSMRFEGRALISKSVWEWGENPNEICEESIVWFKCEGYIQSDWFISRWVLIVNESLSLRKCLLKVKQWNKDL